jgi:threonine aldolase
MDAEDLTNRQPSGVNVRPFRVTLEGGGDIAARWQHLKPSLPRVRDKRFDQLRRDTTVADHRWHQSVIGDVDAVALFPCQAADGRAAFHMGAVLAAVAFFVAGDGDFGQVSLLLLDVMRAQGAFANVVMQFSSDNAAAVHPRIWAAMQAADGADSPYDDDALSRELDSAFAALFGRECAVLWVATGTAANCLALAAMVPPHGGVICHREAHIETDECGAPGFYTHGAKLMLAEGEGAKITPDAIAAIITPIRKDVHQVQPHTVSIAQASEYGLSYRPSEVAAIVEAARSHGLRLHMDGARLANAVAFLECSPAEACGDVDALTFGCVKNGGMGAEALVFFDRSLADVARYRRKRAGHLQSKGRFLAAQLLAMIQDGLWLENARAANAAAQEIAGAAAGRLLHPVEANEIFLRLSPAERDALRAQGFIFYDWGADGARLVTAWNSDPAHVGALAKAIAGL